MSCRVCQIIPLPSNDANIRNSVRDGYLRIFLSRLLTKEQREQRKSMKIFLTRGFSNLLRTNNDRSFAELSFYF